jgi:hypothetical protein
MAIQILTGGDIEIMFHIYIISLVSREWRCGHVINQSLLRIAGGER